MFSSLAQVAACADGGGRPRARGGCRLAAVLGRAREYAGIGFLQAKLALVALGTLSALALDRAHGVSLETADEGRLVGHAVVSLVCWLGALVCGRLIAFAGD
jgi:hypothetical protein